MLSRRNQGNQGAAEQPQENHGGAPAAPEAAPEQQPAQGEAPAESSEGAPSSSGEGAAQSPTEAPHEQAAAPQGGSSNTNRSALAQTGAGTTAAWMALGAGATGAAMLMARRRLTY